MLKLLRFLKPFTLSVVAVLGLVLLESLADLYLPTLMADIVDIGIFQGDVPYILRVGGLMLVVAAFGILAAILANYLSARTAAGFGRDLRTAVFSKVESFSLQEFDRIGTATLITRTTNDITQLQQVLIVAMRMMLSAPMMMIGGIIMAVSRNARLSLILVAVLPLLAGAIILVAAVGVPLFKAMQLKLDKLNLVLREKLTGIRVIRAFNRVDHERKRFYEANQDLTATALTVNRLMAALMPAMMLVMNGTSIAIVWFGGMQIQAGHMRLGDLMAFIQYALQILMSLLMLSMMFVLIPRASASASRVREVLDSEPTILDPPQPKNPTQRRGFVEFRDVTFHYPGAERPALSQISFQAGPGEVTAIIGGTGSGKSTLSSLLLRFYDVDSGAILVDGVDIREMTQENLRARIGFVPQKTVLFSGTVADNIRYGREYATVEEIQQAAETAQAAEFVAGMEDGLDSFIAQGGTNVSGGQKQRLSIARALVRKPEIYVFDDSFSALDFKTDAKLRAALRQQTGDATVLIVAQRVSTVMDADRIIVLDDGRIVGMGTHRELLDTCEVYREIVASQLSEEETA